VILLHGALVRRRLHVWGESDQDVSAGELSAALDR